MAYQVLTLICVVTQSLAINFILDFYIKKIDITRPDNNNLHYSSQQHLIARIANCLI